MAQQIKSKMLKKKTWKEFRETGLLLVVNQILHIFGWALVFEFDENKVISVYPARTKFRGFSDDCISRNYIRISEYMLKNAEELLKESKGE